MSENRTEKQLIELLLARLERISADSYLAHRASGMRGALIKYVGDGESEKRTVDDPLASILRECFLILENAAKEKSPNKR